ncbi:reverse transcriptase domain-containing protein [Tanacetum coccineum]|uniref:Reverse transcriptase domain-containing protein n=1 Tax=Tanacetum coccineum TaxID=301880 RepID=A0ABQ5CAB2_9ASTR
MPPKMSTQSAGQATTTPRRGRTSGRTGRRGGSNRGRSVYTHRIKKMESVQDMSGCRDNQKVKYTAGSFVDFKTLTREKFCPSNEMQKLETELWNHAMVGAGHAAYIDRFHELARLVPHLVST